MDTVADAVCERLCAAGIYAVRGYPSSLLDKSEGPVVTVRVVAGSVSGSGAGEYLGTRTDPGTGGTAELFGLKMELTLGLDIYCPLQSGAAACAECFSGIVEALFAPVPGIADKALRCGDAAPDGVTEMFRCPVEFSCSAYLVCVSNGDAGEFADFVLRGEVI